MRAGLSRDNVTAPCASARALSSSPALLQFLFSVTAFVRALKKNIEPHLRSGNLIISRLCLGSATGVENLSFHYHVAIQHLQFEFRTADYLSCGLSWIHSATMLHVIHVEALLHFHCVYRLMQLRRRSLLETASFMAKLLCYGLRKMFRFFPTLHFSICILRSYCIVQTMSVADYHEVIPKRYCMSFISRRSCISYRLSIDAAFAHRSFSRERSDRLTAQPV